MRCRSQGDSYTEYYALDETPCVTFIDVSEQLSYCRKSRWAYREIVVIIWTERKVCRLNRKVSTKISSAIFQKNFSEFNVFDCRVCPFDSISATSCPHLTGTHRDPVCNCTDNAVSAILVMRVYIWQLMKYISLWDYFYFLLHMI